MGTHPIFESDFDCLTESLIWQRTEPLYKVIITNWSSVLRTCAQSGMMLIAKSKWTSEKDKLEHDIAILHERLNKVVTNLARKVQIRDEYERTIAETEGAYSKILETSQTLLSNVKLQMSKGSGMKMMK